MKQGEARSEGERETDKRLREREARHKWERKLTAAESPNAALAQRTNPPFSGKAVESSTVMRLTGTASTAPRSMMPMKVGSGPAVWIIVSVPWGLLFCRRQDAASMREREREREKERESET